MASVPAARLQEHGSFNYPATPTAQCVACGARGLLVEIRLDSDESLCLPCTHAIVARHQAATQKPAVTTVTISNTSASAGDVTFKVTLDGLTAPRREAKKRRK